MANRIITITGADCCGKATQARLLAAALGPDTTLMSFPEYDRPLGRLLRAIYTNRAVQVNLWNFVGSWGTKYEGEIESIEPSPMTIQLLNTLARVEAQGRIGAALEKGHVVMDRYDADTFIYGAAQGVAMRHLTALHEMLTHWSDFVFYLHNAKFDRPGEQDCNEKNGELQRRVAENCKALAALCPVGSVALDVTWITEMVVHDKLLAIQEVHEVICAQLRCRGVVAVRPLCQERIEHLVELSDQEKQEALA